MSPLSIAIIEDEIAHFTLMKRAIVNTFSSVEVHHFDNAADCLERLDEITPGIIISDYLMPGMNGIEFLEALNQTGMDIPVIIITGQGGESIAVQAMKLGAWDYLVKSSDFFTLLPSVIDKVIREKENKDLLRETEEKYRLVVDNAGEGILVEQDEMLKFSNPKVMEYLGYNMEELTLRPFTDFIHPDDKPMVAEYRLKVIEGNKKPGPYDFRIISRDGKTKWLRNNAVEINWEGRPALLNFVSDITEYKWAEEELRLERERFYLTLEKIPAFVYLHAQDHSIRYANKTFRVLFGDPRGKLCYEIIRGRDKPCEPCPTKEVFGTKKTTKWQWQRENGDVYILYDNYLTDIDGSPMVLKMGIDITEQKHAEERIHSLTHELIRAQEHERTAISRELHDTTLQDLVALKLKCDILHIDQSEMSPKVKQWTKENSDMLQQTIISLRNLAYDLHPPGLRQWGLVKTLDNYCSDFSERTGTDVHFSSAGMDGLALDSETEINLYRLVQEGLNNIRKHADANNVFVSLVAASPQIVLTIEDDGKGFDVDKRLEALTLEKRMGLRSMKERVSLLGGEMRIESHPGKGAKIILRVPSSVEAVGVYNM
jgi:PAS domain S-box-containing protein